MVDAHFYTKLLVDMFGYMLCAIDRAMAASSAPKVDLEIGKASFHKTGYVKINHFVNAVEEGENFTIGLEEVDDGLV